MPLLARRLGLAGEARSAGERDREVLLDGFVRAHEELDRLQEPALVARANASTSARHRGAGGGRVLQGAAAALADEPAAGEDDRLVDAHRGARRAAPRVDALRTAARSRWGWPHAGLEDRRRRALLAARLDARDAA